mmetsp:Transcript_22494/g.57884  ORF Transcript_22494/g.57884 Transcript_22494/m.57884 type:complete len:720 (-) Transcript_22494:322-2481(-)|eukprot:CAMPEP_0119410896 /NCGR_PEP_ID=MMETSP1335-20130426/3779_1 /TAXON_ID=259385 /ORGANISM="Chrysoculter rhomboideus, Strain RCC1486" /LENGTH=719 /DNA_ID=CAMNT_0007435493 /DNA_START=53 /DNA_END=2212 /DNA_ORIENTATION=+
MAICEGLSAEPTAQSDKPGPRPASERVCTDLLCLIAFGVFWIGMFVIAGTSVAAGDLNAIKYGADYRGNRCGVGEFADRPKTMYPRLDLDLFEQNEFMRTGKPWLVKLYGLCVRRCVTEDDVAVDAEGNVRPVSIHNYLWQDMPRVDRQKVWTTVLPEVSLLNRCWPYANEKLSTTTYCFEPDCDEVGVRCDLEDTGDKKSWQMNATLPKKILDQCEVAKDIAGTTTFYSLRQTIIQDYVTGWLSSFISFVETMNESRLQIAVCALIVTFALCYLWVFSLRVAARIVVYTMIGLMFAVLFAMVAISFTYSCFITGNDDLYNCTEAQTKSFSYNGVSVENTDVFRVGFFICLGLFIAFIVSMCTLGKAIETCIAIVQESSVVVGEVPTIMVVPFCATTCSVLVFLYWTYIGAFIATSQAGDYADLQSRLRSSENGIAEAIANDDANTRNFLLAYHTFGTLWSFSFVIGVVMVTLAGTVSQWFFFRNSAEHATSFPVLVALKTTVMFHLGTVAFGSLLIAIAQFLRIILEYVDQRTKDLQESNIFARLVLKCVKCCMWCLENCLKFITGYSYIYTAIEGMSFCNAARNTFLIIMKYPGQVYVNHLVQSVLKILQSITVPFIAGIICYYWVDGVNQPNPMYAALVTIVFSFFITRIFAAVYEVIIESIFICSFRDRDMYNAAHTPDSIKKAFGLDIVPDDTEPTLPKAAEPQYGSVTPVSRT